MTEPKNELRLMSKPEFVSLFLSTTRGWTKKDIAIMVWEFANGVWGDGYKQGKDDPEFEEVEEWTMTEPEYVSECCPDCHGEGGWHGEFYIWNKCVKCDGRGYLIMNNKPCRVKEERNDRARAKE